MAKTQGAKTQGWLPNMKWDSQKLEQVRQQYLEAVTQVWSEGLTQNPSMKDRRFSAPEWSEHSLSAYSAALYQLNAQALTGMLDAVQADEKTRSRMRFAVEQWVAASAPSNFFALNAEAQKKAVQTKGKSITQGLENLLHDMRLGHISMTDESQFEVGKNLAVTEGAVVYENDYFQLIEYKPLTAQVHERPFLLVPPCINKYYILDLQPDNSFIRYTVAQGHRCFVVSWRNPDDTLAHATWDDFIDQAVIRAIDTVVDITGAPSINALGFCVGGTMLVTALAVLAARGQQPVHSATFLTTLMDFSNTGVLDIFIDEEMVRQREEQMGQGGLMSGRDLAATFAFLRPNELVWNYVVGNYLKGETPMPFDMLYWNCDSTNLPGPFYAWYLRNTYLENRLIRSNSLTVCGEAIDLGAVDIPVYIYGSRDDHIVPIDSAYASTQVLTGPKRFVMGASGHIAGVINPAQKNKRSHWVMGTSSPSKGRKFSKTTQNEIFPADVNDWIASASEKPGSWWTDWAAWLGTQAGSLIAAPSDYGTVQEGLRVSKKRQQKSYTAIEAAPGRYVKAKIQ